MATNFCRNNLVPVKVNSHNINKPFLLSRTKHNKHKRKALLCNTKQINFLPLEKHTPNAKTIELIF